MNILTLFINFTNSILNFKIFNLEISTYLITITLVVIVIAIIKNMSN